MANRTYKTDGEVQEIFRLQLKKMVRELKAITPRFSFFLNDWKNLFLMRGGTVHTAVRQRRFYVKLNGISMAQWLGQAVEGNLRDVGLELL